MRNKSFKIYWKNLLFPVWEDFKSINQNDTGSERISINNLILANDNEEYDKFLAKIVKSKEEKVKASQDLIIVNDH